MLIECALWVVFFGRVKNDHLICLPLCDLDYFLPAIALPVAAMSSPTPCIVFWHAHKLSMSRPLRNSILDCEVTMESPES